MADYGLQIWKYLISNGCTKAGAAGILGNMKHESGVIPNKVEILCLRRIQEYYGENYDDASYTAAVDGGKISRSEFVNPLPDRQYGYGLCQWTSPNRKAGLYDLCKEKRTAIGILPLSDQTPKRPHTFSRRSRKQFHPARLLPVLQNLYK